MSELVVEHAGVELGAVAQWLQQAPVKHEAALARALAAAPAPYFEGPVPGEAPLSAAAAVHGFGSGRHLTADELAARRPDGYKVKNTSSSLHCSVMVAGDWTICALLESKRLWLEARSAFGLHMCRSVLR